MTQARGGLLGERGQKPTTTTTATAGGGGRSRGSTAASTGSSTTGGSEGGRGRCLTGQADPRGAVSKRGAGTVDVSSSLQFILFIFFQFVERRGHVYRSEVQRSVRLDWRRFLCVGNQNSFSYANKAHFIHSLTSTRQKRHFCTRHFCLSTAISFHFL